MANSTLYGFGNRIRLARLQAGLTQEALAEQTGVSRTAVVRWESGEKEPKLEHLCRLCTVLQITSDALLGLSPPADTVLSSLSEEAQIHLHRFILSVQTDR